MRRALVALVLLLPVAGCASEQEAFCDEVAEQQEPLTEVLGGAGPDALIRALPHLRSLQEKAPRDVRDEYDVVVGAIEDLQAALDDAGVDPATFDRDDLGDLPGDERVRIEAAATALGSAATKRAFDDLEQQARDVCKTPLTL